MIDIRQLKCGSHVLVDGQRVKVCGVTRRKVGYHHSDDRPNANLRYARVNETEPIAITPELLTELGFKQDNDERLPEYTYWRKNHKGYPLELTYWGEHSNSQNRDWSEECKNKKN